MINDARKERIAHLLSRLIAVQRNLGFVPGSPPCASTRFADVLDSMGMVEYLAVLAEDFCVTPGAIEQCVNHHFGTVLELAAALDPARLDPATNRVPQSQSQSSMPLPGLGITSWLAATAVRLPEAVEPAAFLNEVLKRPPGWLERHAGIQQRRVWAKQNPLDAAAEASAECLTRSGLTASDIGVLLVTSEAPPLLTGWAAALHHRLGFPSKVVALEIGGACTGFLAALWTAQQLLLQRDAILVVSVEAATRVLEVRPGPAGEAAALFGDAAAATLLCAHSVGQEAVPLQRVCLGALGGLGGLLRVERSETGAPEVQMSGVELASRAVEVMAQSVRDLAGLYGLELADLAAVIAHGGNGRLPALLALKLGLPAEKIWSETPTTGNLGSASLPVAWAAQPTKPSGPLSWTALGAGLTYGAALLGNSGSNGAFP